MVQFASPARRRFHRTMLWRRKPNSRLRCWHSSAVKLDDLPEWQCSDIMEGVRFWGLKQTRAGLHRNFAFWQILLQKSKVAALKIFSRKH
jgi:hypothetical protein